jgi:hypothetical protein
MEFLEKKLIIGKNEHIKKLLEIINQGARQVFHFF